MIRRALGRISRRLGIFVYAVLVRPLDAREPAAPPGIALRLLSAREALAACAEPALELATDSVQAALDRGEACVGAFEAERLVGYAWFARQAAAHVEGIWMDFGHEAVYIYRALVRPEYRGRGIAAAMYRAADRPFLAQGRSSAVICIDSSNRASLRAAKRSGARTAGFAGYFKAGRMFFPFDTPGARRIGFGFHRPEDK